MTQEDPRSFSADLAWSYAASAARVASWIVISAATYRLAGADALALLTLVRTTLALLNYASAGLAPAIIHHAARPNADAGLIYSTGVRLSWLFAAIGLVVLLTWSMVFARTREVALLAGLFGSGVLVRISSDAWGAILQSRGRIRMDSQLQGLLEVLWATLAVVGLMGQWGAWHVVVGGSYLVASVVVASLRWATTWALTPTLSRVQEREKMARRLLSYGGMVVLGQLADFFYAPADCLLIRYLIDLRTVADYSPAIQIDAGLLLLTSGLAAVLLPRSADAFSRADHATLRRYYVRGTSASFLLLLVAALIVWWLSPHIFRLWFNDAMPATQAILPLVLIHTVIGGASGVGRSILIAMGRARAYTVAALLAGAANVLLSFIFVKYCNMGLRGIVLGTIIVVVARCGLWMPWYVFRVTATSRASDPAPLSRSGPSRSS